MSDMHEHPEETPLTADAVHEVADRSVGEPRDETSTALLGGGLAADLEDRDYAEEAERKLLQSTRDELTRTRQFSRFTWLALIAAMFATVLTALATLVFQSAPSVSGSVLAALVTCLSTTAALVVGYYYGSTGRESLKAESRRNEAASSLIDLLEAVNQIERAAATITGTEKRRRTVTQYIPELVRHGLWDDDDVYAFREALRVRNHLVHGDGRPESEVDLDKAVDTVNRLLNKLVRSAVLTPPGTQEPKS